MTTPRPTKIAERTDTKTERRGLAFPPFGVTSLRRSACALQGGVVRAAHDPVVEALEEQLPTAARAERLIGVAPCGRLTAGPVIGGTELLDGRLALLGRHKHLPETVTAEVAVELSAN